MPLLRDKLRLLAREDGITLVLALMTLTVLSITGGTLGYYSSTNARSSTYSKAGGTAFQLAEAGLHESLAVLSNQPTNDPDDADLLPERTSTYSTGTVTWSGTYDSSIAKWTITSTGKVANPAGIPLSEATRTVTAKIPIRPVATQTLAVESWNYVFSYGTGDPSGCDMTTSSTVSIETRLLVTGNLCMTSRSTLDGAQTELLVGGMVTLTGNDTRIGQAGAPIARADVAGGCQVNTNPRHTPCQGPPGNADRVWASTITTSPGSLAPPNPDWAWWYSRASPGPLKPCVSPAGTPPTFDVDTTRNRNAPAANLTPVGSYTCKTWLGPEPLGELSWDDTNNKLTVRGTIFIDGNAEVTQAAYYEGQAAIYLSGSFYIGGTNRLCAVMVSGNCDFTSGAWEPNNRLLTIVTNGAGGGSVPADATVLLNSSAQWQGAIYGGPYKARVESSARFAGPLIADEVALSSSIQTEPFSTISAAPTGMPGNSTIYAKPDKLELFSG